ncbi:MAG: hypothetical protein DWQ36_21565 [Acidobacteria bacterium]|nr:MAG: hypothetical protein DWQ30_09485 [Acidobacteriota bacterium]REK01097.1 MAG: hypothetical protein DWQ36_21565 [Acidobacteriota bacterium]
MPWTPWIPWTPLALAVSILLSQASPAVASPRYEKLAPYPALEWKDEVPFVRLDGEWYELRAIDSVETSRIVGFARQRYAGLWQKRFVEDLVEVLSEMGHPPGRRVDLEVAEVDGGAVRTLHGVRMTAAKRRSLWEQRNDAEMRAAVDEGPLRVTAMNAVLERLETALDERWAYRFLADDGLFEAIEALRRRTGPGLTWEQFTLEIETLLALGVDGHASVSGPREPSSAFLPFLLERVGEGHVGFLPNRRSLLDPARPYVASIDGLPIARWWSGLATRIARGSPQFVGYECLRRLRDIERARQVLGRRRATTSTSS